MKKSNRIFKVIAVTVILALVINLLPDIFGTNMAIAAENGGNSGESGVVTANGKIEMKIYNDSDDTAQIPYTQELRAVDGGLWLCTRLLWGNT